MPRLSVWTVRAALLYLLTGFTFGALMLANKGQPFWPQLWALLPVHVEFLLLGWTALLALGVAFWILPRFPGGSRGNERLAVAAVVLLNAGLLLALFQIWQPVLLLPARVLEVGAGVLYALHAWPRIRPLVIG